MNAMTCVKLIGLSAVLSFSTAAMAMDHKTGDSSGMKDSGIKQVTPAPESTVQEHLQTEGRMSDSKSDMDYGFRQLDQNRDGMVSRHEVPAGSPLKQNWNAADRDASGGIDRAEFSAFETTKGVDVEKVTPTPDAGETVQDHLQTEEK